MSGWGDAGVQESRTSPAFSHPQRPQTATRNPPASHLSPNPTEWRRYRWFRPRHFIRSSWRRDRRHRASPVRAFLARACQTRCRSSDRISPRPSSCALRCHGRFFLPWHDAPLRERACAASGPAHEAIPDGECQDQHSGGRRGEASGIATPRAPPSVDKCAAHHATASRRTGRTPYPAPLPPRRVPPQAVRPG